MRVVRRAGVLATVVVSVVGGAGDPAVAQPCGPGGAVKLVAATPRLDARLGQALALSADGLTVAAGAHWDRVGTENRAGTVSVWRRGPSGWSAAVTLHAGDYADGDEFGNSVALSADGSTLAVGAYLDDRPGVSNAGAVYIFVRSGETWTEQAKLIGGTTGFYGEDYFGAAVALSADGATVVVGAPRWDQGGYSDEGALHVFARSGSAWSEAGFLRSTFGRAGDVLGYSVAISADGAVIAGGAGDDDTDVAPLLLNAGSVAVFRKAGPAWTQEVKLFASDPTAQEHFGYQVALSGDGQTLAVGMPFDSTPAGALVGSVRVYRFAGGWAEIGRPAPSAPGAGWQFGFGVSLTQDGGAMLVGSFDDTVAGQIGAGSAYVFDRAGSSWTERARLLPPAPELSGHFGITAALAEDGTMAVGEYRSDVAGQIDAGAVWVSGAGCRADLNCDGIADFADYLEFLNLYGAQDPAVDFNQDGVVDFADYLEFLNLYEVGC